MATDVTATEAPLEIRLQERPFAVIMRTPGADRQLVAGFLLAERLVRSLDDLATIEHCADGSEPGGGASEHIIRVVLDGRAADRAERLLESRRDVMANSACGVCGRSTLESMRDGLAPLHAAQKMTASMLASLPARLRARQPLFETTGGLHAAGVFDLQGELVVSAEDVGRHNAVDKVTGTLLLRDQLPAPASVLCVSGRTSYEIVQKAWCAGIPVVASVSAPSSLAVSLAAEAAITLIGFVRNGGLNIYTGSSLVE
jgi:FdhD protein